MVNVKDDKYFVNKILESIEIIERTYDGKTIEDIKEDTSVNNVIMLQLILIGENSIRLSDEYKKKKNNIEWSKIRGMRNLVVHNYDNISYDIIGDTLTNDIDKLKKELSK